MEDVKVVKSGKTVGRWRNLWLMSFAALIDGVEGGVFGVLFTVMRGALGLTTASLGVISALSKLVGAIAGPLWGIAGDRYSRKAILVFATGIWGLWTVAIGLSQTYTQLLILIAVAAAGSAATVPLINSVLTDLFPNEQRGKATGIVAGIIGILGIVAIVLMGSLGNIPDGWRLGYFVSGGLSVLSGVLILLFFKEPVRGQSDEGMAVVADEASERFQFSFEAYRELFKIPSLNLMLADKFLIGTVTLFTFMPTFLVDFRGFTAANASVVLAGLAAGLGIGRFFAGWLSDRAGRRTLNARPTIYHISLVVSFFLLIASLVIDFGSEIGPYALLNLLLGFALAFDNPIMHPMIARITTPELRSSAYGIWQSGAERLGDVVFTLVVGLLANQFGLDNVLLYLVSGLVFVRIVIWFLIYRFYPGNVAQTDHELATRRAALT